MPNADHPVAYLISLVANAQRQLAPGPGVTNGSVVRVPADGTVGTAYWTARGLVLVHRDRTLGRGPWYMHREQVELAPSDEVTAYQARCRQLALHEGSRLAL